MKHRPDLPPRPRGRPSRGLTSAAVLGKFELPVCLDCGTVQYPVRDICGNCLSDRIKWQAVGRGGTLLNATTIRHSTEAYFLNQPKPPLQGMVKLDAGPVCLVRLADGITEPGTRVRMGSELDRSGEAILVAALEGGTPMTHVLPDPNCQIEGKVVLVTGANGGIGAALVRAFAKTGAKEVIAGVRSLERVPKAEGTLVTPLLLDVTDPGSVSRAMAEVGPRVDILVNNAGVTASSGLLDAPTMDGARSEIEVNYFGTLAMIRGVAPHLRAKKQGVVVNLLSILSHVCLPSMGSYCASKAAALSLTQGVRAELLPWGVRVCAIFPSTVDTPASTDSPPPKLAPARVAEAVVEMIRSGVEESYPGPIASDLIAALCEDAKTVEREMANALPEPR